MLARKRCCFFYSTCCSLSLLHSRVAPLAAYDRASVVFLSYSAVGPSDWVAKPLINQACLGKWAELRPNEGPIRLVCVQRRGGFRH